MHVSISLSHKCFGLIVAQTALDSLAHAWQHLMGA